MTDLPERLRHLAESLEGDDWEHPITARDDCLRAADEIERLREALQSLYDWHTARDTRHDAEYRLAVRGAEEALRAAEAAEREE